MELITNLKNENKTKINKTQKNAINNNKFYLEDGCVKLILHLHVILFFMHAALY